MKDLLLKSIARLESAKRLLNMNSPIVREEGSREDVMEFRIGEECRQIDLLIRDITTLLGALESTRP